MKRLCLQSSCAFEYGITRGIDGKDLICLVEQVRNSLCN
ncbi:hypothetical protein Goklo_009015 [Gossypium klotzschianum]|uniref:Uncharacterized protein n=1 Tax=Gossypium klotzschianum TaxID=34286 RepID=A0A7J8V1K7_9ROSI|nr:hypothetical protein [Gossypium klotzschianum]